MNKIIAIGFLGGFQCYLNLSKKDACLRALKSKVGKDFGAVNPENLSEDELVAEVKRIGLNIVEFTFEQEFGAYEVYPQEE